MIASRQPRPLPIYQHHQRPGCQRKSTWNQVCVLAGQKLSPSCCLYENDLQFPRDIWLTFSSRGPTRLLQREPAIPFFSNQMTQMT